MKDRTRKALEAHDLRRWTRMVKIGGEFDHLRCYCGEKIFEDSEDAMFKHVAAALASQPSAEMVFTEQEQRLIDTGKRTKDSFFSCVAESASGPKETSVGDLQAKLEALRDEMAEHAGIKRPGSKVGTWAKRLTAIIEGKD